MSTRTLPDRLFAAVLLVVTLGYGAMALFSIKAPFQYDPLGPESWPQLLAAVMLACLVGLLWRPDSVAFDLDRPTGLRLLGALAALLAYAELFEPLGFVISTFLFSLISSRALGAGWRGAIFFGLGMGVGGYLLCAGLLDLNLPEGPLPRL